MRRERLLGVGGKKKRQQKRRGDDLVNFDEQKDKAVKVRSNPSSTATTTTTHTKKKYACELVRRFTLSALQIFRSNV
jgi:hypothetical protein